MSGRMTAAAALGLAASLAGCAGLQEVRDFAESSSNLANYPAVADYYVGTADRVLQAMPSAWPGHERWQLMQTRLHAQRQSILQVQSVVAGYMGALAQVAGDGAFSLDPGIASVSGALQADGSLGLDASHVQAYSDIASKIVNWVTQAQQERDVRTLIQRHGESMDKLLEAMDFMLKAMDKELDIEAGEIKIYYTLRSSVYEPDPALANTQNAESLRNEQRKEAVAYLLRERNRQDLAETDRAHRSLQAVRAGVQEIRNGHDTLRHNLDRLNAQEVKATLKQYASDIKSIRDTLKAL